MYNRQEDHSYIHKAMWEPHLNSLLHLNRNDRNDRYDSISLHDDRLSLHDELYRAAEYLFKNRGRFIFTRLDAAKWMKKRVLEHMSEEEIHNRFLDEFTIELTKLPIN